MATAAASLVLQKYGTLPRNILLSVVFPSSLPGQWEDFRRSGLPTSMGLVDRAARRLTPHPTPPSVLEAFASGNPMAEFVDPTSGRRCVLDFLRKILIAFPDANGSKVGVQAFYWVDEDGELFMSASLGGVNGASVVQSFLGPAQGRLAVTSLRRCRHRAALVFGFLDKMKYRDTWLFGWYGASSADVEEATNGGDVPDNWQLIGPEMAHGRGVHVSAVDCLQASASLSLRSANGQPAKVLFCALALGSMEVVPPGSSQTQPTSSFFHMGTDSIASSKWYVFWKGSSATSILPLYEVTISATP